MHILCYKLSLNRAIYTHLANNAQCKGNLIYVLSVKSTLFSCIIELLVLVYCDVARDRLYSYVVLYDVTYIDRFN